MPDGRSQLGSYKPPAAPGTLAFIQVMTGDFETPAAGTLNAWIADPTPPQVVILFTDYVPNAVNRYISRGGVRATELAAFPDVEAAALVTAGIAGYVLFDGQGLPLRDSNGNVEWTTTPP